MSEHRAEVVWTRGDQDFLDLRYSRRHLLRFDGGAEVAASSSPHSVPLPMSDPGAVDPEEAFVASVASCHMLWFLAIAAKRGFCIDRYADAATGTLGRDADGRMAITRVTLRPDVAFGGARQPGADDVRAMHHAAHEACFIANSIKGEVVCEPVLPVPPSPIR